MIKVYRATTRLAFPVVVDGKKQYVKFSDDHNSLSISDEKVQEYIENSPHFKRKEITLFKKIGEEKKVQTKAVDPASEGTGSGQVTGTTQSNLTPAPGYPETSAGGETSGVNANEGIGTGEGINNDITPYPDVTDINGAVALLKGEPYKVHHMKLQNPTAILEQAKLNNVSFPNWTPQ
ncbi:MAG: hypothetical protein QM660_08840 [Dysgonomonas sp.]